FGSRLRCRKWRLPSVASDCSVSPFWGKATFNLRRSAMRNKKLLLGAFVVLCCSGFALGQLPTPPPEKTPGDALNAVLSIAEHDFVPAAEAMPEDKYSFAPSAGEFRGVRTFAEQVKHVAAVNYTFGASVLQEKPPVDTGEDKGPATVKSKAEI